MKTKKFLVLVGPSMIWAKQKNMMRIRTNSKIHFKLLIPAKFTSDDTVTTPVIAPFPCR